MDSNENRHNENNNQDYKDRNSYNERKSSKKKKKKRQPLKVLFILIILALIVIGAGLILTNKFFPRQEITSSTEPFASTTTGRGNTSTEEAQDVFKENNDGEEESEEELTEDEDLVGEENIIIIEETDELVTESSFQSRNPGDLNNRLKLYLRDNGIHFNDVGMAYYNLEDETYMGHNDNKRFLAASTSKVPVVMYLFDLANEGIVDLDEELEVEERHMAGGTGIIQDEGPGGSYALYDLAELSITHSDNVATNMLYEYIGNVNSEYVLNALNRVYGLSSYDGNYMTPEDAINVMARLYYNEANNPLYDDLLDFMKKTIYNDYFTKDIYEREIAHKTGDFLGYYNDIGIVFNEDGDYAFACYTNNIENPEAVLNDLGYIINDWHSESDE